MLTYIRIALVSMLLACLAQSAYADYLNAEWPTHAADAIEQRSRRPSLIQ